MIFSSEQLPRTSDKLLRVILLTNGDAIKSSRFTPYINHAPLTVTGQDWNPGFEIQESLWTDKSNNGNHARPRGTPSITPNAQNNLGLMSYGGASGEYHEWEKISDIKTVFWVVRKMVQTPILSFLVTSVIITFIL